MFVAALFTVAKAWKQQPSQQVARPTAASEHAVATVVIMTKRQTAFGELSAEASNAMHRWLSLAYVSTYTRALT